MIPLCDAAHPRLQVKDVHLAIFTIRSRNIRPAPFLIWLKGTALSEFAPFFTICLSAVILKLLLRMPMLF